MNWVSNTLNLGTFKQGAKIEVTYQGKKDMPKIVSMTASCGCTTPKFDEDTKVLTLSFKAQPVPFHLRSKGFYETTKRVFINYEDGTNDSVKFKVKVTV